MTVPTKAADTIITEDAGTTINNTQPPNYIYLIIPV